VAAAPDTPPPLGLYVHLPWCVSKCPYCDFNSHPLRGPVPAASYVEALLRDLELDLPLIRGRAVGSVYFGGGTPSLFPAALIGQLLRGIAARLELEPGTEVTLEANPGTIERDSFTAYREAGVNRVSLGVQSFQAHLLHAIGRIHGSAEIEDALRSLQGSGIDNFNIDLMYGLPGQSRAEADADVEAAVAAAPAHVSHYQLTLEPNTAFAAAPPELPDPDACWDMQEAGAGRLRAAGFNNYEVSAWAAPGRECRHNLNYWRYGDFLGIGAGAHAKLTMADGSVRRRSKQRHPRAFMEGARLAEDRVVAGQELIFEFFLNHLRLRDGFEPAAFTARTGLAWEAAADRVGEAFDRGLLESRSGRIRPTALGWRFVNDTQAIFLPGQRV
jgi:oxygen-independent coproporphyrinogen-3 oxidase